MPASLLKTQFTLCTRENAIYTVYIYTRCYTPVYKQSLCNKKANSLFFFFFSFFLNKDRRERKKITSVRTGRAPMEVRDCRQRSKKVAAYVCVYIYIYIYAAACLLFVVLLFFVFCLFFVVFFFNVFTVFAYIYVCERERNSKLGSTFVCIRARTYICKRMQECMCVSVLLCKFASAL